MNNDFFFNSGLQFEPWAQSHRKLMMVMPEIPTTDGISRSNWEYSDQYSQFESALSSMVSSPGSYSTVSNDIVAIREVAGKLAGENSPAAMTANTPLISSPAKLNLPVMDHFVKENFPKICNSIPLNSNLPIFPADPGFAERAAMFSCFGRRDFDDRSNQLSLDSNKTEIPIGSNVSPVTSTGRVHVVSSTLTLKNNRSPDSDGTNTKLSRLLSSAANSNEESSVSEQILIGEIGFKNPKDSNARKRKGGSSTGVGSKKKKEEENDSDESKRLKKTEHENGGKTEEKSKPVEPSKDYIHVRARRGQATDSHSLAERVRREKISERMKLLQNLVPNCNKVTGKALMLDEIINYVQSLQRQVEFLSMKLATVKPSFDFDTNDRTSQKVNKSNGNLSHQTSGLYPQDPQLVFDGCNPMSLLIHEFADPFPNIHGFGQDDLESIVQMGFGENLDLDMSFCHSTHDQQSMKVKL